MTLSPRLSSASSTALPNACWPWTTIRIRFVSPSSPSSADSLRRSVHEDQRLQTDARALPGHDDLLKLRRRGLRLLRRRDGARGLDVGDLLGAVAQHLGEDFLGVLAKQRRALHLG